MKDTCDIILSHHLRVDPFLILSASCSASRSIPLPTASLSVVSPRKDAMRWRLLSTSDKACQTWVLFLRNIASNYQNATLQTNKQTMWVEPIAPIQLSDSTLYFSFCCGSSSCLITLKTQNHGPNHCPSERLAIQVSRPYMLPLGVGVQK